MDSSEYLLALAVPPPSPSLLHLQHHHLDRRRKKLHTALFAAVRKAILHINGEISLSCGDDSSRSVTATLLLNPAPSPPCLFTHNYCGPYKMCKIKYLFQNYCTAMQIFEGKRKVNDASRSPFFVKNVKELILFQCASIVLFLLAILHCGLAERRNKQDSSKLIFLLETELW